jgi:hypothetical protein
MVAFLKKIKLSLGLSRAHFFRPHLPKVVRMCVFQHFLRNWALASVSCTFYRRLFQIEACTRGNTDPPTRDPWGHHTRKKQWFVRHCAPTLCQTQVHALLDCYCDLIYCFHLPTAVASSMINILTWRLTMDIHPYLGSLRTKLSLKVLQLIGGLWKWILGSLVM